MTTGSAFGGNSDLTLNDLLRTYDTVRSVVYVHPDDVEHPVVVAFRDRGYTVVVRETMVAGKGAVQNIAKFALLDFEKNVACVTDNPLTNWLNGWPSE